MSRSAGRGDRRSGHRLELGTDRPRRVRAASLVEVLFGAMIIGISALPILQLLRSSTASLAVTKSEAAARTLAADVLERFAAGPILGDRAMSDVTKLMLEARIPWRDQILKDELLSEGFPEAQLAPVLDKADVWLKLSVVSVSHPALGPSTGLDCYRVTASWMERQDRRKEVTFARIIAHR